MGKSQTPVSRQNDDEDDEDGELGNPESPEWLSGNEEGPLKSSGNPESELLTRCGGFIPQEDDELPEPTLPPSEPDDDEDEDDEEESGEPGPRPCRPDGPGCGESDRICLLLGPASLGDAGLFTEGLD